MQGFRPRAVNIAMNRFVDLLRIRPFRSACDSLACRVERHCAGCRHVQAIHAVAHRNLPRSNRRGQSYGGTGRRPRYRRSARACRYASRSSAGACRRRVQFVQRNRTILQCHGHGGEAQRLQLVDALERPVMLVFGAVVVEPGDTGPRNLEYGAHRHAGGASVQRIHQEGVTSTASTSSAAAERISAPTLVWSTMFSIAHAAGALADLGYGGRRPASHRA